MGGVGGVGGFTGKPFTVEGHFRGVNKPTPAGQGWAVETKFHRIQSKL